MKAPLAVTFLACAALLLGVGCGKDKDSANQITIGHFASKTGNTAGFGTMTDMGVLLAVKERNAAGGVSGKQIKLITVDTEGQEGKTVTQVTRLVTSDKVDGLIGEVASGLSLAAGSIAEKYGVPMVSPSSTNPAVTQGKEMVFRVCFIDPFQGEVCAKFAMQQGWKKAATFYDSTQAYSTGLNEAFKESYKKLGGELVVEQSYKSGDAEFTAQLSAIRDAGADVIFVPGYYTEVGNIAKQARELGIKAPLLGGDGWTGLEKSAKAADIEGDYNSDHYSVEDTSPAVAEFIKKFKAEYGQEPDSMAALGYDAANVLFDAFARAKSTDGKKVAAELARTADFNGVTGNITIDPQHNARKPAVIVKYQDGKPRFVTRIEP